MRTYLILKEKARRYKEDAEIQELLTRINTPREQEPGYGPGYRREWATALKERDFDRAALGRRGLAYERLDQLVVELLLGVR